MWMLLAIRTSCLRPRESSQIGLPIIGQLAGERPGLRATRRSSASSRGNRSASKARRRGRGFPARKARRKSWAPGRPWRCPRARHPSALSDESWSSNRIVPESGLTAPATIFIKVDLPAPFSPTTAHTLFPDGQAHIGEGAHAAEQLRNAGQFQQGRSRHGASRNQKSNESTLPASMTSGGPSRRTFESAKYFTGYLHVRDHGAFLEILPLEELDPAHTLR